MTAPIRATGGFCAPPLPAYDFHPPRVIPATFAELADLWAEDIRTFRRLLVDAKPKRRARLHVIVDEYARARRAITHGPLQGAGELVQYADRRAEFLVRHNQEHPDKKKRFQKLRLARISAARTVAQEMRKCAEGGGEIRFKPVSMSLPVIRAPRGSIRFIGMPTTDVKWITPPDPSPDIDGLLRARLIGAVGGDAELADSLFLFAKSEGERLRKFREARHPSGSSPAARRPVRR